MCRRGWATTFRAKKRNKKRVYVLNVCPMCFRLRLISIVDALSWVLMRVVFDSLSVLVAGREAFLERVRFVSHDSIVLNPKSFNEPPAKFTTTSCETIRSGRNTQNSRPRNNKEGKKKKETPGSGNLCFPLNGHPGLVERFARGVMEGHKERNAKLNDAGRNHSR